MRTVKQKQNRPWINSSGVALTTAEIAQISKDWDAKTWESYLTWYQGRRKECLVHDKIYDQVVDATSETLFESHGYKTNEHLKQICTELLNTLPQLEAKVLKLLYLEGRTQCEIAFTINRSQKTVSNFKYRALTTLKRGHHGDDLLARRIMRGCENQDSETHITFFDLKLDRPIKERRIYRPDEHEKELLNHPVAIFRESLQALPPMQRRILYLRYFCDSSYSRIARYLKIGINTVSDVDSAAVSKMKRNLIENYSRNSSGEENLCA